jgi:DNA invertase Pin-like site-specific DNA recombinase
MRAGLRNAKAKGKKLGRPRATVDAAKIAALRSQGLSWAKIGKALGLGEGTVRRSRKPLRISGPHLSMSSRQKNRCFGSAMVYVGTSDLQASEAAAEAMMAMHEAR